MRDPRRTTRVPVGAPTQTAAHPIVITGMHRSGTSMVAGMLAAGGVAMGHHLIPGDRRNPDGYFEDLRVVAFHGRLFRRALAGARGPHVDWGVTEAAAVDVTALHGFVPAAREAVRHLIVPDRLWGFKDPRASVVLPLWERALPDARFVLVYRCPWQVADSMQRTGFSVFEQHPAYAYHAWLRYNQALLAFVEAHRDRCVLVSATALATGQRSGDLLADALARRLDLALDAPALASVMTPGAMATGTEDDRRADLVAVAYPECIDLLRRLDDVADIPGGHCWRSRQAPTLRFATVPTEDASVSVIIPTWNDGPFLLEALASVERWAPADTELIVVDDGSTSPESCRIIERLKRAGYQVIVQPNRGLSAARNAGIARARGRLVLPLDADNRLVEGFLERARASMDDDPGRAIVFGDRKLFGRVSAVLEVPEPALSRMLFVNTIDACALYRREMWEAVGGYDTSMVGLEDWEFWLHAAGRGYRFSHLPGVSMEYRVRRDSLIARSRRWTTLRRLLARIRARHVDLFLRHAPRWMRPCSALLPAGSPAPLLRFVARAEWAVWMVSREATSSLLGVVRRRGE